MKYLMTGLCFRHFTYKGYPYTRDALRLRQVKCIAQAPRIQTCLWESLSFFTTYSLQRLGSGACVSQERGEKELSSSVMHRC